MVLVCPACRLRLCRSAIKFAGFIRAPSLSEKSKDNTALRSGIDGHGRPTKMQEGLVDVAHRHAYPARRNTGRIGERRSDNHGGIVMKRKPSVVVHRRLNVCAG